MSLRQPLALLVILFTTAACGGGGGGGAGTAAVAPADFVHTVTNENRVAHATRLENPLTFGRPDLILLVTQNRSPEGSSGEANRSPVGVLYDRSAGSTAPQGRWMIVNRDITREPTMRAGMAFNVSIFEPGQNAFVFELPRVFGPAPHIAHLPSAGGPIHGARDTRVFVTQRLSRRDGTPAAPGRDSLALYFTGGNWAITNQNGISMQRGAAFNIVMVAPGPTVDAFATSTARGTVWYSDDTLSGNAILHISQGPADTRGRNDREVALRYTAGSGRWGVVNIDGSSVHQYATFKVLIRRP